MSGPRLLVVGTGSIARRHMSNMRALFKTATVACVSASGRALRPDETPAHEVYTNLQQGIEARPLFAVIASPAPLHLEQAALLSGAGIPVLIEKPLSSAIEHFNRYADVLNAHRDRIDVGYNLRYLASAVHFREFILGERVGQVHRIQIEVGQYLPDWRPGTDYRRNVSAQRGLGGGALLELSHELDYLRWIFGEFDRGYCVMSTSNALEVDVEDQVCAIVHRAKGPTAAIHLDFLQRAVTRVCKVVGEHGNLIWNLAANRIDLHTVKDVVCLYEDPAYDRNAMYVAELARFAQVARGELPPLVNLGDALATMHLIEALRRSAELGQAVQVGDRDQ